MNTETHTSVQTKKFPNNNRVNNPFIHFIFQDRSNRLLLLLSLIGSLIQFITLKLLYPFPDFISDSYSYIATNSYNMNVNLWPIGYSKFILLINLISSSDTFLVATQYVILNACLLYLFFTIKYLYNLSKLPSIILLISLLFNPLFLYLSNCVLSDALFTGLTAIFLAQFLWMLHKPTIMPVLIQSIILGLAFTIRYTAIYYPLVALFGLLLSKHNPAIKLLGTLLGVLLMLPFVLYTKQKTKEITGTAEFSVFGGWQIANNALYMYDHIQIDTFSLPKETLALDRLTRKFFLSTPTDQRQLLPFPGTYFIKVPYAPLKQYLLLNHDFSDAPEEFKAWGKVSPIYMKYGSYLILHHPFSFARYYLALNTVNYFLPHLEKFGNYNLEMTTVPSIVQDWFNYTTPDVYERFPGLQQKIFFIYPTFFMMLNLIFLGYVGWLTLSHRLKKTSYFFRSSLILISIFLAINFCFSILSTPIVLRYQTIPIILLLSSVSILLNHHNYLKQANTNQFIKND